MTLVLLLISCYTAAALQFITVNDPSDLSPLSLYNCSLHTTTTFTTTITTTTLSSSGGNQPCSLRAAWYMCQSGEACVINILPSVLHVNTSLGPMILNEDYNITLFGNGSTIHALQPSVDRFIVYNSSGSGASSALSISRVGMDGFGSSTIDGGTIFLSGDCALSLDSVWFTNNSGYNGGALYIRYRALPIVCMCYSLA